MSDVPAHLISALAGRYRIERLLGRGGMATVYLAADLKHGRPVAIKVLTSPVAGLVNADRFLQEIRVMASLQHPHILPLFDSGEAAGELYYVMPYVAGETLRDRMNRERRLGVQEATRIAREVAGALDFAHRRGIVHRDIKPENILLADGHALVADFGIARALLADPVSATRLTATGVALGTPGYMSPEQMAGDSVDARTDVYALGAVTHEMLAGEPPFSGPSAQVVMARVLTGTPPPLTELRRGVPPALSAAVQRALAPEPADRFADAGDFGRALESGETTAAGRVRTLSGLGRGLLAAIGLAAAVAGGWWLSRRTGSVRADGNAPVRIAVLPFRESGDTAGHSGFAAGLTTTLRRDLATLPHIDVIAGTSVDALGDSARIPRYVAQQLQATHLLSGTVLWERRPGGALRVRVIPELIVLGAGTEQARTGEPVEDAADDLFRTQSRVSAQIAGTLGVAASTDAVMRLSRPPTRSREAYQAYLRSFRDDDTRELLQQAVALDSSFAPAWAELGLVAGLSYQRTLDPLIAETARLASERALALDSTDADAHFAMALYQRHVRRDFPAAVRHGRDAMRLAPGNATIMSFTAAALWNAGQIDAAADLARRAAALDPRNPDAHARVATILLWKRDFATAEPEIGMAIRAAQRRKAFINVDSLLLPASGGDLSSARAFANSLTDGRPSLLGFALREWYQGWVLDSAQRQDGLAHLGREGRDYRYYAAAAQHAWLLRDIRRQKAYADSAITSAREGLRRLPNEERIRLALAFAYAFNGQSGAAASEADTVSTTRSVWKDGFQGAPISLNVAEIRALSGQRDHAIALLDSLLKMPGFVTPAYLRIDPFFDGLRADPRFRALVER